jgi:hypothetical protein
VRLAWSRGWPSGSSSSRFCLLRLQKMAYTRIGIESSTVMSRWIGPLTPGSARMEREGSGRSEGEGRLAKLMPSLLPRCPSRPIYHRQAQRLCQGLPLKGWRSDTRSRLDRLGTRPDSQLQLDGCAIEPLGNLHSKPCRLGRPPLVSPPLAPGDRARFLLVQPIFECCGRRGASPCQQSICFHQSRH